MKIKNLEMGRVWDYENGFYWFSDTTRINKLIYHYELYKLIQNIPGDILEFGVFKGISLLRFCHFRDALENNYTRKIVGFDYYGKFPTDRVKSKDDLNFIKHFEDVSGYGCSKNELMEILNNKGFKNFELVEGNIFDTLPGYLKKNPETRLSLLHLDLDVAEPTKFVLETMYDRVVAGGLIVIDDYNSVTGATKSVDEFIKDYSLKLETLSFYAKPSFIRKI